MRKTRTTARQRSTHSYGNLENRKMLTSFADAPLFTGTPQSDQVEVRYVDEHTVDIQVNDTLHEGVDSTNGIRINLGSNSFPSDPDSEELTPFDNIAIDQRIRDSISVSGTEGITIVGDEGNLVQTSYLVASFGIDFSMPEQVSDGGSLTVSGATLSVIGNINDNISFIGATDIQTGAGDDVFNLSTNGRTSAIPHLFRVNAGAGDDLIRFAGQQSSLFPIDELPASDLVLPVDRLPYGIVAEGEGGNDRFVYRDLGAGTANGGAGFDTSDHQNSTDPPRSQISVAASIERHTVSAGIDASATLIDGDSSQRFEWDVDGAKTVLTDVLSGTSIELLNYNRFVGSEGSTDTFFVSSTVDDLKIVDADFVWVTSARNGREGDLGGIHHEISFENRVSSFSTTGTIDFFQVGVQRVGPTVFISDATGDGLQATFGRDQTVSGIGGGSLKFFGNVKEMTVFGSTEAGDSIIVEETWAPTTVYTRGGDDTFMVGSSNRDGVGNLAKIQAPLTIGAGAGTDRIYLNNQSDVRENLSYAIDDRGVRVTSFADLTFESNRINFNSSMTVARVNGAIGQQEAFSVRPLITTRIVVAGNDSAENPDRLQISTSGEIQIRQLSTDDNSGSVIALQGLPVHFYGIEDVSTTGLGDVTGSSVEFGTRI